MEQLNLFGEPEKLPIAMTYEQKIQRSIDIIKLAARMSEEYYHEPLVCCFSGGKDSSVLLDLVLKSGVDFEASHSHTTLDFPETVRFTRKVFAELRELGYTATIKMPTYHGEPTTAWKLFVEFGSLPGRIYRFCCDYLKESASPNRLSLLGVRAAESGARKGRDIFAVKGTGGGYSWVLEF